jgi:hypothetical protein
VEQFYNISNSFFSYVSNTITKKAMRIFTLPKLLSLFYFNIFIDRS